MACVALPFAAEAALVRAQLQQGVELAVVWALKAGLLEEEGSDGGASFHLSRLGLAALTASGAGLVHTYGVVTVLLFPVLLLAWVARMVLGAYQAFNILVDLGLGATILLFLVLEDRCRRLFTKGASPLRARLQGAESYAEYRRLCAEVDREEGRLRWREEEKDLPQAVLLRRTIEELEAALREGNLPQLKFLLGGVFRRNHLGVDALNLHSHCLSGTKVLLERYQEKLKECLRFISSSPDMSKAEKEGFLRAARRSLGRTALCLSGGGSMAMYHLGVVRGLIEAGVFRYLKVITGASGGSILAALLAIKTEEELLNEVLTEDFSTDFKGGGRMKEEKVEWFFKLRGFPIMRLLMHEGVLDKAAFERTVAFYIGDWTFAEAFARTQRHVTISVSHSSLAGYKGAEELLLNHLTTPNVLIRSAVVASCSLPGILKPSHLLSKNTEGEVGPFYLNGVQWVDGSIQADIPLRGVSTMFSVSNCIVSQVNFHVVLGLRMPGQHEEARRLLLHKHRYWSLFKMLATDIKYRAVSLRQLGLFPTVFGQDISGVFQQTYSGQVTIIPPFRFLDSWGTNAILTPGKDGIRYYLHTGRRSCWRHLTHIKYLMAIEIELAKCMAHVAAGLPIPPPPHSLLSTRRSPTTAASAERQLSIGASLLDILEDEEEDDNLSVSAWSHHVPRTADSATAPAPVSGPPATGPTAAAAADDDDDLVVGEFTFTGAPHRASLRKQEQKQKQTKRLAAAGTGAERAGVGAPSGAGGTDDGDDAGDDSDDDDKGDDAPPHTSSSIGVLEAMLSPAGRRARQLTGALHRRLRWLEQENQKLSDQLSLFLGAPAVFDPARLGAAMREDEGFDGDEEEGEEGEQRRVSLSKLRAAVEREIPECFERSRTDPGAIARQRRHSTQG